MLLELKDIKKHFKNLRNVGQGPSIVKAVDGVQFSVLSGENVGLVGESGSGKSTLAKIILKLADPDHGVISFEGKDVTACSKEHLKNYRKNVQMVFQDPFNSLDPRYSVRRSLLEALELNNKVYKLSKDKENRIRYMIESVGLTADILNRFPHEFSGGERQRIAIARALLPHPRLLVLDEAVSSLDVIVQKQILDLLIKLQDKFQLTYLFISHNLKVVKLICRKTAVMYKGKIVEYAPTEEIFKNPLHPYTQELLSAALSYKSLGRKTDFSVSEHMTLHERLPGHFILD